MDFSDLVAPTHKVLVTTSRLENLLYICDALGIKLSEFFSDKRFDEAEANEWRKKPEL